MIFINALWALPHYDYVKSRPLKIKEGKFYNIEKEDYSVWMVEISSKVWIRYLDTFVIMFVKKNTLKALIWECK